MGTTVREEVERRYRNSPGERESRNGDSAGRGARGNSQCCRLSRKPRSDRVGMFPVVPRTGLEIYLRARSWWETGETRLFVPQECWQVIAQAVDTHKGVAKLRGRSPGLSANPTDVSRNRPSNLPTHLKNEFFKPRLPGVPSRFLWLLAPRRTGPQILTSFGSFACRLTHLSAILVGARGFASTVNALCRNRQSCQLGAYPR